MSLDQILLFYTENIHLIIQSLVTLILLLLLIFAWRVFFSKSSVKSSEPNSSGQQKEPAAVSVTPAEELTPIDAKSRSKKESSAGGDFVVQVQQLHSEMAGLKAEIEERNRTIKDLKTNLEVEKTKKTEASVGSSGDGVSAGGDDELSKKLQERINELEEKLAEYEIIEDDIADLSFFKSEVARLQKLVEKQEEATTQPAAKPAPQPEAASKPPEEVIEESTDKEGTDEEAAEELPEDEESLGEEDQEAQKSEAQQEPAVEDNPEVEEPVEEDRGEAVADEPEATEQDTKVADEDSASSEPETTMSDDDESQGGKVEAVEEAGDRPPVAPSPIVTESEDEESEAELDEDLLAEFAAAVGEDSASESTEDDSGEPPSAIDGELDLDKMASEASEILSEADNEEELDLSALKSDIDPEKLAEEAFAMAQATGDKKDKNESE